MAKSNAGKLRQSREIGKRKEDKAKHAATTVEPPYGAGPSSELVMPDWEATTDDDQPWHPSVVHETDIDTSKWPYQTAQSPQWNTNFDLPIDSLQDNEVFGLPQSSEHPMAYDTSLDHYGIYDSEAGYTEYQPESSNSLDDMSYSQSE